MAVASSAVEVVQKKADSLSFPVKLWSLNRKVSELASILESPPRRSTEALQDEPIDIHKALEQVDSLVGTLINFYERCRQVGYTNRTLTATQLRSIRSRTESIADFAERIRIIIDPSTDELFEFARQEYLRGESVGLEAIL
jgi:hypothetical protein